MKHKVSELEGALLDFAVARAERHMICWRDDQDVVGRAVHANDSIGAPLGVVGATGEQRPYSPSTLWEQGGPIIERERISLRGYGGEDGWQANAHATFACGEITGGTGDGDGPTPLIAAMRAYVASKLGEEVELP